MIRRIQAFPSGAAAKQRGVALIVGLVLLVVLALMGAAAYSVATQEERMAGSARDHARAFQSAEYALRECERLVLAGATFDASGTTNPGMYLAQTNGAWFGDTIESQANALKLSAPSSDVQKPLCLAESFKPPKLQPDKITIAPGSARVTAAGYGFTTGSKVILVSYVKYLSTN